MLTMLYFMLGIMYLIFMFVSWFIKLERYIDYKDIKFKDLFNIYDLGLIIFPMALISVTFAIFIAFMFNLDKLLDGERGIFKKIFK